jgi:hypothetical protein
MALALWRATIVALVLTAGTTTLDSGIAFAAPSEADKAKARALMDEGDRRVDRGDQAGALVVYRQADAIMSVPTTGIEVARTLVSLGKLIEAREVALAVVRIPTKAGEARVFGIARRDAAELARDLERRIPSLRIDVDAFEHPSTVSVKIDGVEAHPPPLLAPRKLDPGPHTLVIAAPDYRTQTRTITLAEGDDRTVDVELVAVAPRKRARRLVIAAPAPGDRAAEGGVSPLVYVGFGVGAAGLAVGGVAGAMSLSHAAEAKEFCTNDVCAPAASEDLEASKKWGNISTIGFAVGGVGVAIGVVGLLTSGGSERPSTASVEPVIGPRWTGVRGRF